VPVLVVVPETTTARSKELIAMEDAEVVVHGKSWQEANEFALAACTSTDAFIHPFDDPLLWQGHASMIDEVARDGVKPGAVVLSVGGGGLLCGVVEGLQRNGWHDVPVIAAETRGADSYAQALAAGHRVVLDAITSVATSLGARSVCDEALAKARGHRIESAVVSDKEAVQGAMRLLDEQRVLVEPACGASVAALDSPKLGEAASVLVIVCGGVGVNTRQLQHWAAQYGI
jgi:L-serine/L-threonine ammonia-lyase